jgi:hypothetical protein
MESKREGWDEAFKEMAKNGDDALAIPDVFADEIIHDDIAVPSKKRLTLSDFSFAESQKALEHYKGSFSDAVIEERLSAL